MFLRKQAHNSNGDILVSIKDEKVILSCDKCGNPLLIELVFKDKNQISSEYTLGQCKHYKWGLYPYDEKPKGNPLKTVDIGNCIVALYEADKFPEEVKTVFQGMFFLSKDEMNKYLKEGILPEWFKRFLKKINK